MRAHGFHAIATLTALFVCALVAAGCGDDETTTTSAGENAQQTVGKAVDSCTAKAQQLGGVAGTALDGACTEVGTEANQALTEGGETLSDAEKTCTSSVSQLPAGQAQDALTQLCDAISAAE